MMREPHEQQIHVRIRGQVTAVANLAAGSPFEQGCVPLYRHSLRERDLAVKWPIFLTFTPSILRSTFLCTSDSTYQTHLLCITTLEYKRHTRYCPQYSGEWGVTVGTEGEPGVVTRGPQKVACRSRFRVNMGWMVR